jgi:hypothetical protein
MKTLISAFAAALLLTSCQKAAEPAAAPAATPAVEDAQTSDASAGEILGPPAGIVPVTQSAQAAIAEFRNDAPVTNEDRPVNWDEILEHDVIRREMFYRAEGVDPSVITAADRSELAKLEASILEQACANSLRSGNFANLTDEKCARANLSPAA